MALDEDDDQVGLRFFTHVGPIQIFQKVGPHLRGKRNIKKKQREKDTCEREEAREMWIVNWALSGDGREREGG